MKSDVTDQGPYYSDRFVLREETTWEDVAELASSSSWPLVERNERDRDAGVDGQMIWRIDDLMSLHYIEDAISGIGYVVVVGQQPRTVDALTAVVVEALHPWTLDELYDAFDNATGERERAQGCLRLGLAAPPSFERGVFDRISECLTDQQDRVRYAGIWATTYAGYAEFMAVLSDLVQREDIDWIRERAEAALAAYRSEAEE